jgi:DNA-directed RNA polymerase subunit RPC12/RpoP
MQKYKCVSCGKTISKAQYDSHSRLCGACMNKKPSPRIAGKRLW